MLYATGNLTRRLFRPGDLHHPQREGAKILPSIEEIPSQYRYLLDWYKKRFAGPSVAVPEADPILSLRGQGKEIWAGEDPDAYVRRLRGGWE